MKRVLSIGFALCLLVTVLLAGAVGVSAARDGTVVVSDVSGFAGDAVTVSIRFVNNPGLISAKVDIQYDATVLQLVEAEEGDFPAGVYTFGPPTKNPFTVLFVDGIAKRNYTDELFATLHFKIKEDAPAGAYPITAICNFEDNFFNTDWQVVALDVKAGSVTVKQPSASATQSTLPPTTTQGSATQNSSATMGTTEAPTSTPAVSQSAPTQGQSSVTEADTSAAATEMQIPTQSGVNTTVRPSRTIAKEEETETERTPLRPVFLVLIASVVAGVLMAVMLLLRKQKKITPPEE